MELKIRLRLGGEKVNEGCDVEAGTEWELKGL